MTDKATERSRASSENKSAPIDGAHCADTRNDPANMPRPTDPRTMFLGGLLLLAVLMVLYFASEIVPPVMLAIVLKLLLQPLVRAFDRIGLPRPIGALVECCC